MGNQGYPPIGSSDNTDVVQPVTVDNETGTIAGSRQLVNGSGTTVDTSTAGQIKINSSASMPTRTFKTGSYTITTSDQTVDFTLSAPGAVATLPTEASMDGKTILIINDGSSTQNLTLAVAGGSGDSIVGVNAIIVPGQAVSLLALRANEWHAS